MSLLFFALFAQLSVSEPVFAAEAPLAGSKTYELEEVLKLAMENSPAVHSREFELGAQRSLHWLSWRDLYLPKLTLSASASDTDTFNGPLTASEWGARAAPTYSLSAGLTKSLNPLKDLLSYRISLQDRSAAELRLLNEQRETRYRIRLKHLDYSLAHTRLDILNANLRRDGKLKRAAQLRYQKGLIPKGELERATIAELNTKSGLESRKAALESAALEIGSLVGMKKPLRVRPLPLLKVEPEKLTHVTRVKKRGADQAARDFHALELERYEPLRLLAIERDAQENRVDLNRTDFLPSLDLAAGYEWNHQNGRAFYQSADAYSVTLSLSVPLFDSLDTWFRDRAAVQTLGSRESTLEKGRIEARNEMLSLCIRVLADLKRFEHAEERYALWKGIYSKSVSRFERGALDLRFVLDDQAAMNSSALELAELGSELLRSELTLGRLTGENI